MLELASPLWSLAALAAIPLVWWLHRFQRPRSELIVSALILWRSRAADQAPGARESRADPAWRLRAFTAACLFLAVAQPLWRGPAGAIVEVWFDDSPSMASRETDGWRWELAARSLVRELQQVEAARVDVRSLSNPGRVLTLPPAHPERWERALAAWLEFASTTRTLPAPRRTPPDTNHWLVSDGADPALVPWLEKAALDRVIQVGAATENVAVTRLSLRRSLSDPERHIGLVEVRNLGRRAAPRRLTVRADGRTLRRLDLMLEPGQVVLVRFELEASVERPIEAAIGPADALRSDDQLTLDAGAVARVPVAVELGCERSLRAALGAHPALAVTAIGEPNVALRVSCGPQPPAGQGRRLWFLRGAVTGMVAEPLVWEPAARALRDLVLQPEWLRRYDGLAERRAHRPILSAGGRPLIVAWQAPSRVIEVRIDMAAADLVGRPEFAALVGGLVDLALGRALLDAYSSTSRAAADSRIAPRQLPDVARVVAPGAPSEAVDLTAYLMVLAVVLLLVDIVLTSRRHRPARPRRALQEPTIPR